MTIRTDSFALTPTLWAPVSQHALRGHGAELYPDRSGNALHLSSAKDAPGYSPDGYGDTCALQGTLVAPVYPQLQILGDLTVTVRAWARGGYAARQFLNNCNDGTAVASPFCFLLNASGKLCAAVETSTQVSYTFNSNLSPKWGRWALYSMRRDLAAGTWTLGVDTTFETSSPMTVSVPLSGTQPKLFVCGPDVGTEYWLGGSVDHSVWDKRLTDAQIAQLVRAVGL